MKVVAQPQVVARIAGEDDLGAVRLALAHALTWRSAVRAVAAVDVIRDAGYDYLLEGWGRSGDLAVVAEIGSQPVVAAWYRHWKDSLHSDGYLGASTPELGVGVDPSLRGRGVGTALLAALIDAATDREVRRLSLSVEGDNAAVRLYERLGFVSIDPVDGPWLIMMKELG